MAPGTAKPTIGIVMGDPAGIGPEVALKSLGAPDVYEECHPFLIGDYDLLERVARKLGIEVRLTRAKGSLVEAASAALGIAVVDVVLGPEPVDVGRVSRAAGSSVLDCIRRAFELSLDGQLQGIAMAPINKESLMMTGSGYHSEFELFADLAKVRRVRSVVHWGSVFRATVTGHVPFREIVERLSVPEIVATAQVLSETIRLFDIERPRLAVAALNPHGGEGGLVGDEEGRIIAPAVEALAGDGMDVKGPIPADTVFVRAMRGEFDGVVFLYHDQGNIAMKAVAFGQAVVIYRGVPMPIVTPGHGSAYDIAGRGIADAENMLEALKTVAFLARKGSC